MWAVGGEKHADKVLAVIGQISALCVRFSPNLANRQRQLPELLF